MTKLDAESLYKLTKLPEWTVFIHYLDSRLEQLHADLEWVAPEKLGKLQGQVLELKHIKQLDTIADDILRG
jgi:hypothetical protein